MRARANYDRLGEEAGRTFYRGAAETRGAGTADATQRSAEVAVDVAVTGHGHAQTGIAHAGHVPQACASEAPVAAVHSPP
jgi:hypothetical protein